MDRESKPLPYYEMIKFHNREILQRNLGFPEIPPKKEPEPTNWWFNEKSRLPKKNDDNPNPHLKFIELTGNPKLGKSTINKYIGNEDVTHGHALYTVDEPYIESTNDGEIKIYDAAIFPPYVLQDGEDIIPHFISKQNQYAWMEQIALQRRKNDFWNYNLNQDFLHRNIPTVFLSSRGPLDTIIWQYALLTHNEDPTFTIPDEYYDQFTSFSKTIIAESSLIFLHHFNAVIMGGLNQEEAKLRRQLENKHYSGWVVDSPFYHSLLNWQGYFARIVLPRLQASLGIGYLIINGEKSTNKNKQQILEFTKEMLSQ